MICVHINSSQYPVLWLRLMGFLIYPGFSITGHIGMDKIRQGMEPFLNLCPIIIYSWFWGDIQIIWTHPCLICMYLKYFHCIVITYFKPIFDHDNPIGISCPTMVKLVADIFWTNFTSNIRFRYIRLFVLTNELIKNGGYVCSGS